MTNIETMKLALDVLNYSLHVGFDESSESQIKKGMKAFQQCSKAIAALRQAISEAEQPNQPNKGKQMFKPTYYVRHPDDTYSIADPQPTEQAEQEPVAWHEPNAYSNVTVYEKWAKENGWQPLYTAPSKRELVDLTDDEVWKIYAITGLGKGMALRFARSVIAAHKEKNRGS